MAIRDDVDGTMRAPLVGGVESILACAPLPAGPDWRRLYAQEQARSAALQAEAEARFWEAVRARQAAHSWRSCFERCREKLASVSAALTAVRRAARNAVGLKSEVARLRRLLAEAAVDTRKRSTIASLRMENVQLRADLQEATSRAEKLSGEVAQLRSTRETLAKQTEVRDLPQTDRVCGTCGAPYVANGSHVSEIVEVDVRAHKRVLRRRRWRRACHCASSPREVSAPPVARLFANTPYGVSFRARFLYECYACFRPVNRIAAWMSEQGLRLSAGTLSSSIHRFLPLFAPLSEAIPARQNGCALAPGRRDQLGAPG